jgi:LPXTG-site transpeptidase (sortase) family protein
MPPLGSPTDDYVILYSGQYTTPARRALGCASSDLLCMLTEGGGQALPPAAGGAERTSGWQVPATGFRPGFITDVGDPAVAYENGAGVMLEIPKLHLKLAVVGVPQVRGTWSLDWLTGAAGWLEGTAFPGLEGNSVITSHVVSRYGSPGPFAQLNALAAGDYIFLSAFSRRYVYEVRSIANLAASDTSVFRHESQPVLTLVTCSAYNEATQAYDRRLVARAALIQVTAVPTPR